MYKGGIFQEVWDVLIELHMYVCIPVDECIY